MAMAKSVVVSSGSNVTFGLLRDFFDQLEVGEKTQGQKGLIGDQLRAFLEHRNPFERAEIEKVLPYADEEVASDYGYPDGFKIRSVQEQVKILLALEPFKKLDASHVEELASRELSQDAEGWAVIPKLLKVAKNYHRALDIVLDLIAANRQFRNRRKGELTKKHLRLTEKTAKAHAKLDEQPGDFWVFPFQFGLRHAGSSVRRARVCFAENEFGLGVYEAAVLLLTHADRIAGPDQLYIDCAGIEYAPNADGDFFACLSFRWDFSYEPLVLYYDSFDDADEQWGSVSAFLAPSTT